MSFLDIRTVMFGQLITDALCTVVLIFLWQQNRNRYVGMFFWVSDFIFQTTAALLIILRGNIPDWISIGLSSPFVIVGAFLGYLGLERFVEKRSSQIHNYLLLGVFSLVHFYFVYAYPDLEARNLNVSAGLLFICVQCAWLMRRRVGGDQTRMTRAVGWVFELFSLVSAIRIFVIIVSPLRSNDFFQSGLYDTLILLSYQMLLILLTFGLTLMVNRRLLVEVKIQEEKFTKAFHSSPYAILITRLSDGLILDVNRGFEEITDYLSSEAVGKTTPSLRLWVNEADRQQALTELSAGGEVQGREFQFRRKSGRQLTGLFYAEILVVENEQLILSSISDITERKLAEEALQKSEENYRQIFEQAADGIFIADSQGKYIDVNTNGCAMLGYTRPEILQLGIRDLLAPQDLTKTPIRYKDLETGNPLASERRMRRKDGSFIDVEISGQMLGDGRLHGLVRDITLQKQTQEALRESEERYRTVADYTYDWEYWLAPDGKIRYTSPSCERITGYCAQDFMENPSLLESIVHPDDADLYVEHLSMLKHDEGERKVHEVDFRIVRRDGEIRWNGHTCQNICRADGTSLGRRATNRDITERKRAEEALRESESKFMVIFENAPMAIALSSLPNGVLVDVNESFGNIFECKKEEAIGKTSLELGIVSDPQVREHLLTQFKQQGFVHNQELAYHTKTGIPIMLSGNINLVTIGKERYILNTFENITERKRAQERMAFQANLLANISDVVYATDEQLRLTAWNHAAEKIYGWKEEEVLGKPVVEVVRSKFGPELRVKIARDIEEKGSATLEIEHETRSGKPAFFEAQTSLLRDLDGKVNGYLSINRDITERKRVEEALRNSEYKFATLFGKSALPVVLSQFPEHVFVDVNEAWAQLFGFTREELIGKTSFELGINRDNERRVHTIDELQQHNPVRNLEQTLFSKSGDALTVLTNINVITINGQDYALSTLQDITERKRTEQALRESEEKFRKAFLTSPDSININRLADGMYISINNGFSQIMGYSADEVVGKTSLELNIWVNPEDRKALVNGMTKSGVVSNLEALFRAKNGDIHDGLMSASMVELNNIPHIISITRDITERKRAEKMLLESEERYRATFDLTALGIAHLGLDGRWLRVNQTLCDIVGYTREELLNKTFQEITHPDDLDTDLEYVRQVLAGEIQTYSMEKRYYRKDGALIWINLTVALVRESSGEPEYFISVVEDITGRKRIEEEIGRLNDSLEIRVKERTVQLEAANKELEAFAYSVSHDLRAPLRGIDGWSLALIEDYQGQLDEQGRQYLERVRSEAHRMGQLIDDLLQLSRVTRADMQTSPVDLSTLAQTVMARLQSSQPDRQVEVAIQPDLTAQGDATLLGIVLTNLFDNAWKFTGKCPQARIEFGQVQLDGQQTFYVRDNGVGFDMSYAQKLFGAFQRLHKASEFPGTGIGLATVQRIIHRHGGRVWVKAEIDGGATFFFTLEEKV